MRSLLHALGAAAVLLASAPRPASADSLFSARLRGNVADQVIAGFPASRATWDVARGRVTLLGLGGALAGAVLVHVRAKGLVIPAIGFNPSPDFLARVVCHDETGAPFEAARTAPAPLSPEGNGQIFEVVELEAACFAPIVLVTGSVDPDGNRPGNWFAVSAF